MNATATITATRKSGRVTVRFSDGQTLTYGGARANLPYVVAKLSEGRCYIIGARADKAAAEALASRYAGRVVVPVLTPGAAQA